MLILAFPLPRTRYRNMVPVTVFVTLLLGVPSTQTGNLRGGAKTPRTGDWLSRIGIEQRNGYLKHNKHNRPIFKKQL